MAVKLSLNRGAIPARKWMTRGFAALAALAALAMIFGAIMLAVSGISGRDVGRHLSDDIETVTDQDAVETITKTGGVFEPDRK